mgnify:FL=1
MDLSLPEIPTRAGDVGTSPYVPEGEVDLCEGDVAEATERSWISAN